MTSLFLIRHAEAEGNLYRRIQGWYDGGLTELGRRQLTALEARFSGVPLDAVYSSDLSRARETAEAIAAPKGLPVLARKALREIGMGDWEDVCWGWAEHFQPGQLRAFNFDPYRWEIPGGERAEAALERFRAALSRICLGHPGGRVAVVTHGGVLRLLLARLMGLPSEKIGEVLYGDNTCVARLSFDDGAFHLLDYNDASHLPPSLSAFHRESWWKEENATDGRNLHFLPMSLAGDEDGRRYLRRYRETWIASHGSDNGFSRIYLEKARARAAKDAQAVLEVYAGDTSCGVLELAPTQGAEEGFGHIALFFLEREYRSRGLAVQLIGQANSYYRAMGRHSLRLRVTAENSDALRCYRRWGFCVTEREPGVLGETLVMTRPIFEGRTDL